MISYTYGIECVEQPIPQSKTNRTYINERKIDMKQNKENQITVIEQREVLGRDFRIYGDYENPLFLAKDVAEWIQHSNPRAMLQSIDNSEKIKILYPVTNPYGGYQEEEQWFLTEDGLYEILMQSRKPIAKQFKAEVKKILKDVRMYGVYANQETLDNIVSDPNTLITVLTKYRDEKQLRLKIEEEILLLEAQNNEMKPKVEYHDAVLKKESLISTGIIAKDLGMSATKLNNLMKMNQILYKQSGTYKPYSEYQWLITDGYADYYSYPIENTVPQLKWTEKGRKWIGENLQNWSQFAICETA